MIVLDAALEQGKNLVESLRLHVFREDNVIFSLAHRLISKAEFDEMQSKAGVAIKPTWEWQNKGRCLYLLAGPSDSVS